MTRGLAPMIAVLMATTLGGCGTIDQVPLAYVSTIKVGISAESATAQVPGGKVLIGVEATDAALVPVAVGRTCKGGLGTTCDQDSAPIYLVRGNNDISPATFVKLAQAQADAVVGALNTLGVAESELSAANSEATSLASATMARRLLAELEKDKADDERRAAADTVIAIDPALAQRMANRDEDIAAARAAIAANGNVTDDAHRIEQRQASAQAQRTAAKSAYDTQKDALAKVLSQAPAATGTRKDALSVFGSFNANTDAQPNAAIGLKLGKSFSTGVAAQLLTEGMKQAAISFAAADCLRAAELSASATDDSRKAAIGVCQRAQQAGASD